MAEHLSGKGVASLERLATRAIEEIDEMLA